MTETPVRERRVDPGWLFLVAGLGLLGATVLIPAAEDLGRARVQRDRALAAEQHRLDRLARYEKFLAELENGEPSLVVALAERQLNQIPEGREPIPGMSGTRADQDLSMFRGLEPPPLQLPEYRPSESYLSRWTASPRGRMLLVLAGGVCVLVGLMPPSRGRVDVAGRPAT
ncbi:MAG: hypothetical protein SFY69_04895 [Planctomycetota bacterium]|nr:hypothetical protein [Planctomycetota bacterium]